ncbi:glycosyltransferase, partial [Streptomyces caeruleatus]
SSDETLNIIQDFSQKNPSHAVHVLEGPRKGFAKNFLSLSSHPDIQADFFAVSDQDDIWERDKIKLAVEWLETIPSDIPALYT